MANREDEVYLTEGTPEDAQAIVGLIDQLESAGAQAGSTKFSVNSAKSD